MKKILLPIFSLIFFASSLFAQVEPPTNLKAIFQSSQNLLPVINVKLNWDASKTLNAKYVIYKNDVSSSNPGGGGFVKIASELRHTEFFDHHIKANAKYTYYVIAYLYNNGTVSYSKSSDTVLVSTEIVPPKFAIVTGNVTDDSTSLGIKNAMVSFIPTALGVKNCNAIKTDSNGNFAAKIVVGEYIIFTSAHKYSGEYFDNQKVYTSANKVTLNENDSINYTIGLSKYIEPVKLTLKGKVTDSSGVAVKADVVAYTIYSNSKFRYHGAYAKTDNNGNYVLNVFKGDTLVLFAFAKDRKLMPEYYDNKNSFADANRIAVADNISGIDFVLDPKPIYNNSLSGSVKNTLGEGLLSHVTLFEIKNAFFRNKKFSTHSDSLGNYAFSNINPGKYILFVHAKDRYKPTYYRADGVQTTNWKEADSIMIDATSALTNYNFTLLSPQDSGLAIVRGKIKNPNGANEIGAMVYAYDLNNQLAGYAVSDLNGDFTITELEPGYYNIKADKVGYESSDVASTMVDYSKNLVTTTQTLIIKPSLISNVGGSNFVPNTFTLEQNFPNPFNPSTKISFSIPTKGNVVLKIYNILGKEIATLINGELNQGSHSILWDAQKVSSGVYFYTLSSGSFKETRKMVLMK